MLKGIHLTLMIGPAVPIPVPQVILDALNSVQVITTAGQEQRLRAELHAQQSLTPAHAVLALRWRGHSAGARGHCGDHQ